MGADLKARLRAAALARRGEVHSAERSAAACAVLAGALGPGRGRALAGYMPMRSEVDPLPLMAGWDGPVCVPVVVAPGRPLAFRAWSPGAAMVPGAFGTMVPEDGAEALPEVVIVPLVAFTADGDRLGYGGGFYDRTLAMLRAEAVGLAYAAQRVEAIPVEATDVALGAVATEEGLWRGGGLVRAAAG